MPYSCKKPCRQHGCPALVNNGYCNKHKRMKYMVYDEGRLSAAKRGYGHRWRKLSKMIRNHNPICQMDGCNRLATDVDHIIAKVKGGDDSQSNLRSLCHECHSYKTATEDGAFGNGRYNRSNH